MAVSGNTVQECIKDLTRRFPAIKEMLIDKNGDLLPYVNIFLNDSSIYPEEIAEPVKDGDEIYLLYLIGGG